MCGVRLVTGSSPPTLYIVFEQLIQRTNEKLIDKTDHEQHQHRRKTNHLLEVPFRCDLCHSQNIKKRDPVRESPKDMALMVVILRVLLEMFWTQEAGTVSDNLTRLQRDYLDVVDQYTIVDALLPYSPVHGVEDRVGMVAVITMTSPSLRDGIHYKNLGFPSIQKSYTWIKLMCNLSRFYQGGPQVNEPKGKVKFASSSPTNHELFHRFIVGTEK